MSYHIYTTDGIILSRRPFGESNALFYVLTRDLGLIVASAQAVRSAKSKLSSALVEYSFVSLSTVKGKNGWKITSAIPKENFYFNYPQYVRRFVSQISAVLVRMMPGEERNQDVFSVVYGSFQNLKQISEKNITNFEIMIMLRILSTLGYISGDGATEKFLGPATAWDAELLEDVSKTKSTLVQKINQGLRESQL